MNGCTDGHGDFMKHQIPTIIYSMKGRSRHIWFVAVIFLLLSPFANALQNPDKSLSQQRKEFTEAKNALKHGQIKKFERLEKGLEDYPLQGYLRYYYLRRYLGKVSEDSIKTFLKDNADSPISTRLYDKWLNTLARRGKWDTFKQEFRSNTESKTLQCYQLRARLKSEKIDTLSDEIAAIWLYGKSLPKACDPLFDAWNKAGLMTNDLVWQRIELAMKNRKLSLAHYLKTHLQSSDQKWVERWRQMHRRPAKMLGHPNYDEDTPLVRKIVRHGIHRLARRDAEAAIEKWELLKTRYLFSKEGIADTESYIATSAAFQRHPSALEWLSGTNISSADEKVQHWRIRTALLAMDWQAVLHWIEQLPKDEQQNDKWRYWKARALEQNNQIHDAVEIYSELAEDPDYHGFLSSDRLTREYNMQGEGIKYTLEELDAVMQHPGIARARELYAISMTLDARREWYHTTKKMNKRELQLAAILAHKWGWHDRAIITLSKTDHRTDLDVRYPIVYRKQVMKNAKRQKIEPAWILGILRQESAFMQDARSHAGALGLMQLMPRTGRMEARLIKSPLRRVRDLLNVDKNILLGSSHLSRLLDKYDGDHVLATATYNAGPNHVKKWLKTKNAQKMPADLWVETVPFTETRRYIRKVMTGTAIFEHKLENKVTPLQKRMSDIKTIALQ